MSTTNKGWIGVDLDGTLAHYDEWRGITHIGQPVEAMLKRVKHWLAEGIEVRIFTARVGPRRDDIEDQIEEIRGIIVKWCIEHVGQILEVTATKDYDMIQLWDDRCIQVIPNTGMRADGQ